MDVASQKPTNSLRIYWISLTTMRSFDKFRSPKDLLLFRRPSWIWSCLQGCQVLTVVAALILVLAATTYITVPIGIAG